jgi:23S rRNA pseudouridine1911/1915/1917 synthase
MTSKSGIPTVRLLDHLGTVGLAKGPARKALKSGKVSVGGVPTADSGRMVDPARVVYNPTAPRIHPGREVAVVYRDTHLAIVYKPSGMLSVAAPKRGRDQNLITWMAKRFGSAHPVHRIDEPTSGLMMVAFDKDTQTRLKALLEKHEVERRYLAFVHGKFPNGDQVFDSFLGRHHQTGRRCSVASDEGGRRSRTYARRVARLGPISLVEARLETGRTHQVRIHLSEAGFPVIADKLYNGRNDGTMRRLALHAAVLGFVHPRTQAPLRFDAGLPDDMEQYRRKRVEARASHAR